MTQLVLSIKLNQKETVTSNTSNSSWITLVFGTMQQKFSCSANALL